MATITSPGVFLPTYWAIILKIVHTYYNPSESRGASQYCGCQAGGVLEPNVSYLNSSRRYFLAIASDC